MSQIEVAKAMVAKERTEETRFFVRTVKTAARSKCTPEEKIRNYRRYHEALGNVTPSIVLGAGEKSNYTARGRYRLKRVQLGRQQSRPHRELTRPLSNA